MTQRQRLLPYGRHSISVQDLAAVIDVLQSSWLTTGPKVTEFENAFAAAVGAKHAVAVSSGTAALHAAVHALDVGPEDEVIVSPLSFAASANCVLYQGGTPVFADVNPHTLLLDPACAQKKITSRTKAIITVDYAGHPSDYEELRLIANQAKIALIADSCHALGATYQGHPIGSLADLSTFSFHPVKHITTGEGGMISTDNAELANRMRIFRNHGIATDHREREQKGTFYYEMVELGFNYRLSDVQCALGLSQLRRLAEFVEKRKMLAALYDQAFAQIDFVRPLSVKKNVSHSYHLFVIRIDTEQLGKSRDEVYRILRAKNIGVNVHYLPIHLHPYYQKKLSTRSVLCPNAEKAYTEILSLPMFPEMTTQDVGDVVEAIAELKN